MTSSRTRPTPYSATRDETETGKAPAANDYGVGRKVALAFGVMAVLIFGCGGWAATAELAGAVISQGSVVVDQHVKKIQHRDGGIVAALTVRNGDRVEKDALLLRLDDTQVRAELGVLTSQTIELRSRLARLLAETEQLAGIQFPADLLTQPEAAKAIAGEKRLFAESARTRRGQREQLEERVGQLKDETKGIAAQRDAKEKELKLIRLELDKVRELERQKLTPKTRVYALERDEARIAGEHGNLIAQGARVGGQVNEIKLQMLTVEQSFRTDAQKELRTVEAKLAELNERAIATSDRLARIEIRSPITGIVHEMTAHTVGGVVTPAEPVMLIVPEGAALSVELRIAPADSDQVRVGQDVRLRFSSFNQRTTPEVEGRVSYVSADVTHDPKGRGDYYTARATVVGDLKTFYNGKQILPGMPVEAFLMTERRTALSYLTKPITDQFAKTFRER